MFSFKPPLRSPVSCKAQFVEDWAFSAYAMHQELTLTRQERIERTIDDLNEYNNLDIYDALANNGLSFSSLTDSELSYIERNVI